SFYPKLEAPPSANPSPEERARIRLAYSLYQRAKDLTNTCANCSDFGDVAERLRLAVDCEDKADLLGDYQSGVALRTTAELTEPLADAGNAVNLHERALLAQKRSVAEAKQQREIDEQLNQIRGVQKDLKDAQEAVNEAAKSNTLERLQDATRKSSHAGH